ncbi:MAG: flavodoxin domain-containing protein, partial [Planctomycetota bacterium]
MKIALIYGTCTGNTEVAAELIRDEWGADELEYHEVSSVSAEELNEYDLLIIGCSTWDVGELQYDWNDIYEQLEEGDIDLAGTQCIFFGMGDQSAYPDTYQDAIGMLHDRFKQAGASVGMGYTDPSDDTYEASRAEMEDGKFCGLAL